MDQAGEEEEEEDRAQMEERAIVVAGSSLARCVDLSLALSTNPSFFYGIASK